MVVPKIDERSQVEILKQLDELASKYVPSWTDRTDAGYALMQVFSYMIEHLVDQFNKVPNKDFIAFLNMLGTRPLPAQPARAPVKFLLSEGTLEDVLVPAGTQVASSAKDGNPAVTFETEKTMMATVSKLKALYSVDPTLDQVYNHTRELGNSQTSELFKSSPSQEHALYLGHDSLFNLKKGVGKSYVSIVLDLVTTEGSLNSQKVAWEYCWQESPNDEDDWIAFEKVSRERLNDRSEKVTLEKTDVRPTRKKTVDGRSTFWIRARLVEDLLKDLPNLPTLNSIQAHIVNEVRPDLAFCNDVPIDLNGSFYPFGSQPNTFDTFYIGSQEGFSKKDTKIQLYFTLSQVGIGVTLLISWEYWDGRGWSRLEKVNCTFENSNPLIEFPCPPDIAPTQVNSKENYWIRARIASGNYGLYIPKDGSTLTPPIIADVRIMNLSDPVKLQFCLAKNNLQISDFKNSSNFKPFQPLEDKTQAVYLGFDKSFANGRISLFILFEKQEYLENRKPRITWSYLRTSLGKEEWIPLKVLDTTDNLTESGTVEFLGPSDMDKASLFGQELYWLRAEVAEIKFQSFDKTAGNFLAHRVKEVTPAKLSIIDVLLSHRINYQRYKIERANDIPLILTGPCIPETIFHPKFTTPEAVKEVPAAPRVKGIYVNTTWAVQAETVNDEILGTSDGTANEPFSLSRPPVISGSIWVQEPFKPENEPDENVTVTDTGEVWVKWHSVEDFLDSNGQSRHYTLDNMSGQITFGNGAKGMIPPNGGKVKATYQTGGGTKGNIAAGEVKNLITSIASIDKVVNPDSAQGGADTESSERILQRGPKRIQHRQRAVAKEDYEWLAKEASGAVARAKCIPNFSDAGEEKPGCVSVIIVSEGREDRPEASPELVRVVEKHLRSRSPVSLSSFTVAGPTYVGISVEAELYVASMDSASGVKFNAMEKLAAFLHPLYGGYDGKGWGFGEMPCNSDILALLQKIPEVDHVEKLVVTMRDEKTGESSVVKDVISLPGYTLISSDTHRIEVRCTEVD